MMKPIIYHVHGRNVEIPAEYLHLVRMKKRDEIAADYGIKDRELRRVLREHNLKIPRSHLLRISDVIEIYLLLGWPPIQHQAMLEPPSFPQQRR
jgi:hypothetical protein